MEQGLSVHARLVVPESAMAFSFSSSSGPGGQNVNKRATKCLLRVAMSDVRLSPVQLARLAHHAASSLTDAGDLLIVGDEYRSQERNKDACVERLRDLITRAMVAPKVRRATKPTRGSKERRLDEKKRRGSIKRARRDEAD